MNPNSDRRQFEVRITRVNTIDTGALQRLTTAEGASDLSRMQDTIPITLLQVIVSQGPHMQVFLPPAAHGT